MAIRPTGMLRSGRGMNLRVSVRSFGESATTALAVCVGYFVGANLGFILRLPPSTPSVMWPPNAILTATLLLAPPRRWWIYLLAAFPAHLVAELRLGWPPELVLALFATNCSEALIAAALVRRFSDAPERFDTLYRVGVFVGGAVLVAPFLTSFLDAGAVTGVRGEPYWTVWRARFFSNILTELTLVPAVAIVITAGPAWLRRASLRRRAEAAILAIAIVAFAIAVFMSHDFAAIPGVPRSPLAFLLPLLLWATVRFGPGGASLALLATVLVAIAAVTHGYGPFGDLPPAASVPALQMLLTVITVPLMCLAALIQERQRAQAALAERLRFDGLLSSLSAAFVHLPSHEMDDAFQTWLQRLAEYLRLDRLTLLRVSDDRQEMIVSHCWTAPGSRLAPPAFAVPDAPTGASWRWLLRDKPLLFFPPYDPPALQAADTEPPRTGRSDLVIPLVAGGQVLGDLVFEVTAPRQVAASLAPELRLLAEVFAGALARKETEDALRASELMKSAILTSLNTGVAVLDRDGRIIAVNESWTRLVAEGGSTSNAGVGSNYLDLCRRRMSQGIASAAEALAGVEDVLGRSRAAFTHEYVSSAPPADRWFAMSVVSLDRLEGGAVVSHTDVTEQKRAETEAQRTRQELSHFTRVSTMGELTASLAHELSQPLSGILINAQAAQRLLDMAPPDLVELRSILTDIVDDDKRAGEVIQRLRDLLRKSELTRVPLDVNALIRDVARLLSSDAVIRDVTCTLELHPEPVTVIGDRVQLQQVVLNLLLNAMEAMVECEDGNRTIVVRTDRTMDTVHVNIEDAGTGLADGAEERIFEPFYTTKAAGMGMGLSIARSIVLAHEGLIWATRNRTRGATFHIALPLTGQPAA